MQDILISKDTFKILYIALFIMLAYCVLLSSLVIDLKKKFHSKIINFLAGLFVITYIILIGFRAYNVGTDTINYYTFYWKMNFPPECNTEVLFYWLIQGIKAIEGSSFTSFLMLISLLFFGFIFKGFKRISKYYNTSVAFVLFSFMALFFASSLSINVVRQGLSLAILIYAYSLWFTNKKLKQVIPFLVLSFITHTTSIIPILFFILCNYGFKKQELKYFYILYIVGIILSIGNLGILNIAPILSDILQDSSRSGYLRATDDIYVVGFKPQFVAFNSVFLILFNYINNTLIRRNLNSEYEILLKYYIVTSFIFFMAFQIPYSDRWGLFSWITIPILATPLFSVDNLPRFKTPYVLFFIFIFIFFHFYG